MSAFQPITIGGYPGGGLNTATKAFLQANEAYTKLQNAYVFRERTKKRDGTTPMGRLRRLFTNQAIGVTGASPWTFNIYTVLGITPEADAQIDPGTVSITIATLANPFLDQGNGLLTNATGGNSGVINYLTGNVTLTMTVGAGLAATLTAGYFPSLPVMGILKREISTLGIDSVIFFDTVYAYQYVLNSGFQELSTVGPNNIWTGTNTDFFWGTNYQGVTADQRFFFVTNFNLDTVAVTYDPIRYYDGIWNNLTPLITATDTLYQAKIVIPYYGRLLALNTWEGTTAGTYTASSNFFARCRFSKLGDPVAADSWRSDQFGKGGYLDAPTNEQIVSVAFFRNTLIVFFEYSTWQLRYIGEYGLPFIFERISSDFGSVCTFSPILFDQGVMTVSDRGIIQAAANGVTRLDEQIPDTAFSFEIQNNAPNFVHGARDFQKEVVYWNYVDQSQEEHQSYPTTVLLFNYRNNTWAQFRDTITCFGPTQFQFGITWDSLTTFWESSVSWDSVNDQQFVDYISSGNQQGFVNVYENKNAQTGVAAITDFAPTISIKAIDFTPYPAPIIFTSPSHNLATEEIVYITSTQWQNQTDPGINNQIYRVIVKDEDRFTLQTWDQTSEEYSDFAISSASVYIGGGLIALLPKMNIVGKDFNPYQASGKQFKVSYIDFQMDSNIASPAITAITVQLFVNSFMNEQANVLTSNQELLNSSQACNYITFADTTNPCQITSKDHSLSTGDVIYIANVQGMTQLNSSLYTITVIDADTFSLDGIDATGYTAYTKGGIWNSVPTEGQTYISGSEYAWYRFYSNQFGQYLRIGITYDDSLMNQLSTHQTPMELNAMNIWMKEAGRLIN